MAHNGGFYQVPGQPMQQQQQAPYPGQQVYQQPQNIYQQLGKPQPQPHLQSAPTYAPSPQPQQQGFQFTGQQQYVPQPPQAPYQLSTTPYSSPQPPYAPSHTPYIPSQTPFGQQLQLQQQAQVQQVQQIQPYQTSYAPAPAQSPYPPAQMQQMQQYPIQQQMPQQQQQQMYAPQMPIQSQPIQSQPIQSQPLPVQQLQQPQQPHPPSSYFSNNNQSPTTTAPAKPQWRANAVASRPPPVALSATLAQQQAARIQAQQAQKQVQAQQQAQEPQPQPQTPTAPQTPQTAPSSHPQAPQTPVTAGRRPLPQPTPGANAKPPVLPPVLQRVPTLAAADANASALSRNGSSGSTATAATATSSRFPPRIQTSISTGVTNAASSATGSGPLTASPTRNSRPLPTPTGDSNPNPNAGKRATVDLGKLPSGFGTSSALFSTSRTQNEAPRPLATPSSPTKPNPPALPPRSRSSSPTKGLPSAPNGLPLPPSMIAQSKSIDTAVSALSRTATYNNSNTGSTSLNQDPTPQALPRRRASPPRFQSQPGSPTKEYAGMGSKSPSKNGSPVKETPSPTKESTSFWGRSTASTSRPISAASNSTTGSASIFGSSSTNNSTTKPSSSSSNTTTTTAATTDQPPKKFTPMWKRTIPEMPAPVWGYAAGMVKEPHPAKGGVAVPPPKHPGLAVQPPSPTKNGPNKLRKQRSATSMASSASRSSSFDGSAGSLAEQMQVYAQQPPPMHPAQIQRISNYYQQAAQLQQQAYHRSSPVTGGASYGYPHAQSQTQLYAQRQQQQQQHQQESEEETEETEEDDEEEEETDDYEEDEDPRYAHSQSQHRRHYSQPLQSASTSSSPVKAARSRSRPRSLHDAYAAEQGYDLHSTPKSKKQTPTQSSVKKVLRPKPKVDPYGGYTDVSPIGRSASGRRVRPKADGDRSRDEEEDGTPTRRQRILRRDEVEVVVLSKSKKGYGHQRSKSAFDEGEVVRHRREPGGRERERPRPGSAFAVRRRDYDEYDDKEDEDFYDEEDSVRLAYDESDDEEQEDRRERGGGPKAKGRRQGSGSPKKAMGRSPREEGVRDEYRNRRANPPSQPPEESPQWGIRDLPAAGSRRTANGSSGARYDDDYDQEPGGYRTGAGRTGLPQPPAMVRESNGRGRGTSPERKPQGGPRWKTSSAPLKYDDGHDYQRATETSRSVTAAQYNTHDNRTDSRASGVSERSSTSTRDDAWPANLPRLPRTPSSGMTPGDNARGYFDTRSQSTASQASATSDFRSRQGRSQSQGPGLDRRSNTNLDIDDPPPQATVMRTPSPGPSGYTLSQRRELPSQPSGQTQVQMQRRMSLYSEPSESLHQNVDNGAPRRPQSQMYSSNPGARMQSSSAHGQPDGHKETRQREQHLGSQSFSSQVNHMSFNAQRTQPQTPAPPPTIGIESPHPVGGRDRMADIPKLEEDSNDDASDNERVRSRSSVPRINVNSGPSTIPTINVDSSPRMGHTSAPIINIDPPMVNVDSAGSPRKKSQDMNTGTSPRVQVYEVPGVSISGPEFDDGPMINFSGPDDHQHQHHGHDHGQQNGRSPHGGQQQPGFGARPRPKGGLLCGGCDGPIVGRIVSAMGSRWHPSCFKCTVCSAPLEHVSSYEHDGRPYCHLDYHENFAPKCYSCKTAIVEEQFISLDDPALGKRTYHTQHFFCSECGDPFLDPSAPLQTDSNGELALSGDGEFEGFTVYKGYPYCEACHVRLRLPKCKRCKRAIRDRDEAVEALGGKWCWGCFVCASCNKPFEDPSFFQRGDQPYCEHCFSIMLRNEI